MCQPAELVTRSRVFMGRTELRNDEEDRFSRL
jgi:hypothetical protein